MFSELLKKYRKNKNLTQGQLAEKLTLLMGSEIKTTNVQSWERGTNPKLEIIISLAEILDIPEQFLFDDSQKKINKIVNKEIPNIRSIQEHTKKVSIVDGYVGAGSAGMIEHLDLDNYLYVDNSMIKRGCLDKEIKALTVIGDSMSPYVNCRDLVLFVDIEKGKYNMIDGKYIITTINGTMLKNLSFRTNGDIVISSCNKAYSDEIIKVDESQESLDIIGKVVGRILKS